MLVWPTNPARKALRARGAISLALLSTALAVQAPAAVATPKNRPPVASFTYTPAAPLKGEPVTFDGTGSACSANPCGYRWEDDLSDGLGGNQAFLATGPTFTHTWSITATVWIRLIVTDVRGRSSSIEKTITFGQPPPPPPSEPTPSFDGTVWGPPTPGTYTRGTSGPQVAPWKEADANSATSSFGGSFHLGQDVGDTAQVVSDPTGLPRSVTKLTTDPASATTSTALRMQLTGQNTLANGDEVWLLNEFYVPADFPVIPPDPDGWLTLTSVYGNPGQGSGPNGIELHNVSGQNRLGWQLNHSPWTWLWNGPALTPGRWHVLVRHMKMSPDPAVGYMELYYAERGQPLQPQTLAGGATRRYYATLESGVNWDGSTPNSTRISLYHKLPMAGWTGRHSLYEVHRFWRNAGVTSAAQVDPYFTGR